VFVAACDMPFLAALPITWLAAQRGYAPAVAVIWQGRIEPLHAFWSRACLPELERLFLDGEPSMWAVARAVDARLVTEEA
jgi:molybdopterin-guanine dinucleotide biosynthesis protein A